MNRFRGVFDVNSAESVRRVDFPSGDLLLFFFFSSDASSRFFSTVGRPFNRLSAFGLPPSKSLFPVTPIDDSLPKNRFVASKFLPTLGRFGRPLQSMFSCLLR